MYVEQPTHKYRPSQFLRKKTSSSYWLEPITQSCPEPIFFVCTYSKIIHTSCEGLKGNLVVCLHRDVVKVFHT